jgi:hypothetical protein
MLTRPQHLSYRHYLPNCLKTGASNSYTSAPSEFANCLDGTKDSLVEPLDQLAGVVSDIFKAVEDELTQAGTDACFDTADVLMTWGYPLTTASALHR